MPYYILEEPQHHPPRRPDQRATKIQYFLNECAPMPEARVKATLEQPFGFISAKRAAAARSGDSAERPA
jgi:hypothetical protein